MGPSPLLLKMLFPMQTTVAQSFERSVKTTVDAHEPELHNLRSICAVQPSSCDRLLRPRKNDYLVITVVKISPKQTARFLGAPALPNRTPKTPSHTICRARSLALDLGLTVSQLSLHHHATMCTQAIALH